MNRWLNKLIARFDQGCEPISQISSVSLDRRLSLKERMQLYIHFLMCDFCRRYHRQLNVVQKLASSINSNETDDQQSTTPGLDDAARERIRRAIDSSVDN